MSSIQIPNLPAVIGLSGAELFEGVQAGSSVKISLNQIIAATRGGTPATLPIPVSLGGTGLSSFTIGDIMYASATQTFSKLADVALGNAIISGGVGAIPSYGKIGLTTHVSGVLPVANGGTGVTASTGTVSVVLSDSPALTGQVSFADGTAAAPSIAHTGDLNAGLFFPAADTVAVTTGGAERMRVDSSGNVGIGTTTPISLLNLYSATAAQLLINGDATTNVSLDRASTDTTGPVLGWRKRRGTTASPLAVVSGDFTGTINYAAYDGSALQITSQIINSVETFTGLNDVSGFMTFYTRPTGAAAASTERMRITAAGNVILGNGESSVTPIASALRGPNGAGTDIAGAGLTIQGGRGTGTGAGGSLLFNTAAAGTTGSTLNAATERFRIASAGQFGIGGANYGTTGQTIVSAGSGAAPAWGTLPVAGGGTGAITLTGYVKGTGTAALTASATIPNTDISGLGTMSTQAASAVAITGGTINGTTVGATTASTGAFTTVTASTSVLSTGAGGIGYATGAGVAVTQLTSRTTSTPTTGAKTTGAVTLFTAVAVVNSYFSFTVPNTAIAITDTVVVTVRGATNTYVAFVSAIVAATSFQITMASVVGVASDTPIVNFTIIKGVSA